jgi:hypothetical protein
MTNEMGLIITTEFEDLILRKVGKPNPEAIQANKLILSPAVSAGINVLQAAEFIACILRTGSTKTIQSFSAHCGFTHSDLDMSSKGNSESDVIHELHQVRNYKTFTCIHMHFNVTYDKYELCEELFNKLRRNIRRSWKQ